MKACKSCQKEIKQEATKCSYCQSYQDWYRNPQNMSFIFLIPFFIFMIWSSGSFRSKNFSDYENNFTFTEEKVIKVSNSNSLLITYQVKNGTDYKWNRISYEVVSKHNGELLASMADSNYDWVIQPNSESLLTVKVGHVPNANEWHLKIKDLKSDRY
jgi:hypothetical protein